MHLSQSAREGQLRSLYPVWPLLRDRIRSDRGPDSTTQQSRCSKGTGKKQAVLQGEDLGAKVGQEQKIRKVSQSWGFFLLGLSGVLGVKLLNERA